ncbi:MAG TPA: hypothetical protein VL283_04295 [Candidatus Baltobacteraceae bacterium]|jgi:hypothetical protein|nr:hypothetical protein [Candidatus Baltobacteraceae bacterium]
MRAWWIDAAGVRKYRLADRSRLFKWVVFTHGRVTQLVAMPYDAGWAFHTEAMAELAVRRAWCEEGAAKAFMKRSGNAFPEADVVVLGGGTRFESGAVRNFSYRFGPVPEPEDRDARRSLRLET